VDEDNTDPGPAPTAAQAPELGDLDSLLSTE
jgi:hypothetical protein